MLRNYPGTVFGTAPAKWRRRPVVAGAQLLLAAGTFAAVAGFVAPAAASAAMQPAVIVPKGQLPYNAEGQPHGSRVMHHVTEVQSPPTQAIPAKAIPAKAIPAKAIPTTSPGHGARTASAPPREPKKAPGAQAIRVIAINPPSDSTNVAVGEPITIIFSAVPSEKAPMPALVPPVAGNWSLHDRRLTFTPSSGYQPWGAEKVIVGSRLAAPKKWSFSTGAVSLLRTQELLAELGYLPLNVDVTKGQPLLAREPTKAALVPGTASPANFTWRFAEPLSLTSLWSPGTDNVVTQGAVMNFELIHNLPTDGVVGPAVWDALTFAVAARQVDRSPYHYLIVSESLPESLQVWEDGREVYETPVNTGVWGAETQIGTWPVYERFATTTMSGTDPDGYQYNVSGVPWVAYFNGGDAVHGYWRASFGYPQSNGCVELPIPNAQVVWDMDPIGTLVSVV
jgi:L,D-transpeptidase catalytic domain